VVSTWKGTWLRTSANGQTISALAPTHHADLSEGACFNDARVEVAARGAGLLRTGEVQVIGRDSPLGRLRP
jgi:hypothetical protein